MNVLLAAIVALHLTLAQEERQVTLEFPDGSPRERFTVVVDAEGRSVRHGGATRWHANGQTAALGGYRQGERQGAWTFHHENGTKRASGRFQSGMQIGRWTYWTEAGRPDAGLSGVYLIDATPHARGSRLHGQRQGRWQFFGTGGSLALEGHYLNDTPDGIWKVFHPDGSLEPELGSGVYRLGIRVGPLPDEELASGRPLIADLKDCLHALPPPDVDEDELQDLAAELEQWVFPRGGGEPASTAPLIFRGRAVIPVVLRRLAGLELAHPEHVRIGARLVQDLLVPLHSGFGFPWRAENDAPDQAENRGAILRWHTLWDWTRENSAFHSLVLPLARPSKNAAPLESNPLLQTLPPELRAETPALYAWRFGPVPTSRSIAENEAAVSRALGWLLRHQDPTGRFSAHSFSRRCSGSKCDGPGHPDRDVEVTALALLALLGDPDPGRRVRNADSIIRAVEWLISTQNPDTGAWAVPYTLRDEQRGEEYLAISGHTLNDTALASLALCEAFLLYGHPGGALDRATRKAIAYGQSARNADQAWGSRAPPDGTNELFVTGWMTMAQITADKAGIELDPLMRHGVASYLEELTDPLTGRTGYWIRGGRTFREETLEERWPAAMSEESTALAMLCRLLLGESAEHSQALQRGAALLLRRPPVFDEQQGTIDYRYWFFGTQSLSLIGGDPWKEWSPRLRGAVVQTQWRSDCAEGSWDPQLDPFGHRGGRVYATAILALTLEATLRYCGEGL